MLEGLVFTGDPLNFGVSTLEEIRLRKALKSSMRRAGSPIHRPQTTNGEKENIQALYRPAHSEIRGELSTSIVEFLSLSNQGLSQTSDMDGASLVKALLVYPVCKIRPSHL